MVTQRPKTTKEERHEAARAMVYKREVQRRERDKRQMPLEEWEEMSEEAEENPWRLFSKY